MKKLIVTYELKKSDDSQEAATLEPFDSEATFPIITLFGALGYSVVKIEEEEMPKATKKGECGGSPKRDGSGKGAGNKPVNSKKSGNKK